MKLYLASASPRRRELLEQIGATFEVLPAVGEECSTKEKPWEVAEELSEQTALEIERKLQEEECVIVGADTVVSCDGSVLGKPKDEEHAKEMLRRLQGRSHEVYTGVTLVIHMNGEQRKITCSEKTEVTMYPMDEAQIQTYVETGEPMDKAGSYAIQGKCAVYIEKITGDYNNVVGLPVAKIYQTLLKLNIDICTLS